MLFRPKETAENDEQIVALLMRQLSQEYDSGFSEKNLSIMVQFAETFPDEQILATLSQELNWLNLRLKKKLHDAIVRSRKALENRYEEANTRDSE